MEEINKAEGPRSISKGGRAILKIVGWISALVSLWAYPFIFGVIGVIMGILTTKNGGKSGVALIVTSIILMGIGMIFSGVLMNYTRHFLGI